MLIASPSHLFGEQTYIGRFDAYGGFMYFDSPHINLAERGFHFQGGVRARTWLSLGFDFTTDTGHTSLGADLFTVSLQQQIGALLEQLAAAGKLPPGYTVSLPISSSTQTYAAGPQFAFHRWSRVTLYVRPDFGAIHETATLHPQDPIATGIVAQLAPSGKKTDWTPFYGFGGGADVNITKHFALRLNADFVHDHLFSDVLRDGRNTYRLAIGPAFQFGQNVRK
ncbi:MAG: hypothetical protein JO108_04955 [Acidobacteriaceae bacterium]|nr:hypothetical protein [Acidobacteriaceae bacterium]